MKKIIIILFSAFIAFSCQDFNEDHFSEYEDWETPKNVVKYDPFKMVDADYTTIVNALRANKNSEDSVTATKLNSAKKFSEELNASKLIPYLLSSKYYTADVKSSVKVTYAYNNTRDNVVSGLSGSGYVISNDDYKDVWGDLYVSSFTPAKSAETNLPTILAKRFGTAAIDDYKNVEYYYASTEPEVSSVENTLLGENFEAHTAGSGVFVDIVGWNNKDLKGSLGWQCRIYNENNYAQVSSYQSGVENDVWLTTKVVDLTGTSKPKFSFDIVAGNYNATCLKVLISENFDGNSANILSATWSDITSSFTLPEPATGYSPWASAGVLNLDAYVGKKVSIAFRYQGDDLSPTNKKTTTYQLDNIKFFELTTGIAVQNKLPQYASYKFDGSKWVKAGSPIITLQPEDYVWLGLNFLTTAQAPTNLPNLLKHKYPNAQEGNEWTVVYRTANNTYYADKVSYTNGVWVISNFTEDVTDQFVLALIDNHKKWIYDPTLILAIDKPDFQFIVDHVKENEAIGNENVLDSRGNAEFYYGFSAFYPNVTYRNIDRLKDNTFSSDAPVSEQIAFMNQRTKDGLILILKHKYPDAQPIVNGVDQLARINGIQIYRDPSEGAPERSYWSYTFQCVGNKEWKFVSRESNDGRSEKAE